MRERWAPDRRAILKSLGVAVAAETLPFSGLAQAEPARDVLSCFVEEAGRRGMFPLVVGALTTVEPDRHAAAITALRTTHNYKRRLLFTSTDQYKLKFAEDVIGYFAAEPGLRYTALLVTDKDKRWPKATSEKDAVYFGMYAKLLDQIRLDSRDALLLRKRNRTATGRDRLLHDYLATSSTPNAAPTIQAELSKKAELTFVSAFFAGCIRADMVGASAMKSAPIVQFKTALRVASLTTVAAERMTVTTVNL